MRIEEAFLRAHEAALLASAELTTALARKAVFTVLPTREPMPYVWCQAPQVIDDSDACIDGWEIYATTHVWAKPASLQAMTAMALAGIVRETLNVELAIAGFRTVDWVFESTNPQTDPDGSTHVIVVHRYQVEPLPA